MDLACPKCGSSDFSDRRDDDNDITSFACGACAETFEPDTQVPCLSASRSLSCDTVLVYQIDPRMHLMDALRGLEEEFYDIRKCGAEGFVGKKMTLEIIEMSLADLEEMSEADGC